MTAVSRQSLRHMVRQKRRGLSSQVQQEAAAALNMRLQQQSRIQHASTVAIYLTNDGELDTTPFIDWCWQQNKTVCLPRIHPFNPHHLLFLKYQAHSKMLPNQYGIPEPQLNCLDVVPLEDIDIIFTPLVAFDKDGARLGMGGGFYDRTLSRWFQSFKEDENTSLWPIGLAHDCQLVEEIPTEHWDVPIPEIYTPSKHYQFI
ncbi:5-formyltetrahydrofolate cyclo-ligase [Thalassotalea fusca]